MKKEYVSDENIVYCICPRCKKRRRKVNGHFNIIKRGRERNGLARFFCRHCHKWFNEETGEAMSWYNR